MKATYISIIIALVMIGGVIFLGSGNSAGNEDGSQNANNVSVVDGKQIINIRVKGGYQPRITYAKANLSTVVKMETQGSFDCSVALVIPSLKYRSSLPPTGITNIDLPPQKPGSTIRGLCEMGMYNFELRFN